MSVSVELCVCECECGGVCVCVHAFRDHCTCGRTFLVVEMKLYCSCFLREEVEGAENTYSTYLIIKWIDTYED